MRNLRFEILAVVLVLASSAFAREPVRFDVGYLTAAKDITTDQFHSARPGYRLVEIELMVSTNVDSEVADALVETMFRVEFDNPRIQVESFSPQTTLQSPYAGTISKEKRSELGLSAELKASETLVPSVDADGKLTTNHKLATIEKVDILPDLQVVSAAGTINRGRGVYFRFQQTGQNKLEGSTMLGLVLSVPEGWKADKLLVRATGKLRSKIVPGGPSQSHDIDEQRFTVATYVEHNAVASEVASRYVDAESRWQQAQRRYSEEIEDVMRGSPLRYLTSVIHKKRHLSADSWIRLQPEKRLQELPSEVVQAYQNFRTAEREIQQLAS